MRVGLKRRQPIRCYQVARRNQPFFDRAHSIYWALATVLALSFAAISCGRTHHAEDSSREDTNADTSPQPTSADVSWEELTSTGDQPPRFAEESSLAYFMRRVELSNSRRRSLGLEFWNRFANDPRRYEWLILTVHMPPHYPVDIITWAKNETTLQPNAAQVDRLAQKQWDEVYPILRREFWEAPGVTHADRRFLWIGELKQRLLRLKETHARGERIAANSLLNDILDFLHAYPTEFNEADRVAFQWGTQTVIGLAIFENRELLGLRGPALHEYARQLINTGNTTAVAMAQLLVGDSDTDDVHGNSRTAPSYVSEAKRAWGSLPTFPDDQPSTFEARVIFAYNYFISARKFREIGASLLWAQHPDRTQRLSWLATTKRMAPTYESHFVDAIRQRAADPFACVDTDELEKSAWEELYTNLRREIWDNPDTTDEERGMLRGQEIWGQLVTLQTVCKEESYKPNVKRLLEDIHELFTVYGNAWDTLLSSRIVLHNYRKFGLNESELMAFFEPMQDFGNEDLRALAEAATTHVQLRAAPFEFDGKTLSSQPFQLESLRGQIVLVDHWATTCASCIDAMPRIQVTYERYRDKGFEVVSIAYDGTSQRRRVERLKRELGLTWTTLDGEGQWEEISEQYGYQGFPQYMLLNRDGTLYAGTGEVDMGRNLEALLEEMLAAEAAEKESATVH